MSIHFGARERQRIKNLQQKVNGVRAGVHQHAAAIQIPRERSQRSGTPAIHATFVDADRLERAERSEEHTSELQSLMRISYAVFCLKNKKKHYRVQKQQTAKTQYDKD